MKKSLAITTIATILVIVVALTTATFAWFSTSGDTKAEANFKAQASSANFALYKFESATGGGAYSLTSNSVIDFSEASATSPSASSFGIWTAENAKAYAPVELIGIDTPTVISGNDWGGLPKARFYNAASENGTKLTDVVEVKYDGTGSVGTPNVARIKLENFKDSVQKLKIQVVVDPNGTGEGTAYDLRMAEATRFLIVAKPVGGANGGKTVVFGTHYAYGGVTGEPGSLNGTVDSVTYTNTADTGYTTEGNNIADMHAPAKLGNTATAKAEYSSSAGNFTLASGDELELYIYVWMDGPTAGTQLSNGTVLFTVNFAIEE